VANVLDTAFDSSGLRFPRTHGQEQTLVAGFWQLQPAPQSMTPQVIITHIGALPDGGWGMQFIIGWLSPGTQTHPIPIGVPAQLPVLEGGAVPSERVQVPSLAKQYPWTRQRPVVGEITKPGLQTQVPFC
jgi:hypothetical protein